MDRYMNTHNLITNLAKDAGIPDIKNSRLNTAISDEEDTTDSIRFVNLAKELGEFKKDGTINNEKVYEKYDKIVKPKIEKLQKEILSSLSFIEDHAKFIALYGAEKVNPKQQILPGVKENYMTMVNRGAEYIKSRKLFIS
jgi:hypothetical protein